ncbi:MAG: prepilin peptidase [Planctomycetaceae bacterium]
MSAAWLAVAEAANLPVRVDLPGWFVLLSMFVLGSVCGSFLNVCVYRLPKYPHGQFWPALKGLSSPPSACPRCKTGIAWYDNVPIFGWIWLRGRCRTCKMWISPQYPLIELLNGVLFAFAYWCEIPLDWGATVADTWQYSEIGPQAAPGLGWMSPTVWLHLRLCYHLLLLEALLAASLIDLRLMIIPDTVTLPAMAVGVLGGGLVGRLNLVPVWFQEPWLARDFKHIGPSWLQWMVSDGSAVPDWIATHPHLHGLAVSLAGLAVGGGLTWLIRAIGSWGLGREAMGDGDVVLMAMVGSFIGWQPVVIAFFIAPAFVFMTFLARLTFRLSEEIPYGPFLSLGTLFTVLGWRSVWPTFERIFALGPCCCCCSSSDWRHSRSC